MNECAWQGKFTEFFFLFFIATNYFCVIREEWNRDTFGHESKKFIHVLKLHLNYHKEDSSAQVVVRLENNTKHLNTSEALAQSIFSWLKSVSESHTIQKRERKGVPCHTGSEIQYRILKPVCISYFIYWFVLCGLLTRWATFQMFFSIYNSFTVCVLIQRPILIFFAVFFFFFVFVFFKSCVG